MPNSLVKRLEILERGTQPPESELINNSLGNLLSWGLIDEATTLMEQGDRAGVRELIESIPPSAGLTDAQIEWAIDRLANHIEFFIDARERKKQWPAERAAATERFLRADAALLARNRRLCGQVEGPSTDEEVIYAELAAYYAQQNKGMIERINIP